MCGIAGFTTARRVADERRLAEWGGRLRRMTASLRHRGPNALTGVLLDGVALGTFSRRQGDRMLMGYSVEGRFPFLDHRLVEYAARPPLRMKAATVVDLSQEHVRRIYEDIDRRRRIAEYLHAAPIVIEPMRSRHDPRPAAPPPRIGVGARGSRPGGRVAQRLLVEAG